MGHVRNKSGDVGGRGVGFLELSGQVFSGKLLLHPSFRCKVPGRDDCLVPVVQQEVTVFFCDEL